MDRLAEDGTKQHFFCKRSRQIMGKGQSDAIRTAANDNHIILMGSFFAKRAVPKRFFCKRSGSSRWPASCQKDDRVEQCLDFGKDNSLAE